MCIKNHLERSLFFLPFSVFFSFFFLSFIKSLSFLYKCYLNIRLCIVMLVIRVITLNYYCGIYLVHVFVMIFYVYCNLFIVIYDSARYPYAYFNFCI